MFQVAIVKQTAATFGRRSQMFWKDCLGVNEVPHAGGAMTG